MRVNIRRDRSNDMLLSSSRPKLATGSTQMRRLGAARPASCTEEMIDTHTATNPLLRQQASNALVVELRNHALDAVLAVFDVLPVQQAVGAAVELWVAGLLRLILLHRGPSLAPRPLPAVLMVSKT